MGLQWTKRRGAIVMVGAREPYKDQDSWLGTDEHGWARARIFYCEGKYVGHYSFDPIHVGIGDSLEEVMAFCDERLQGVPLR